MSRLTTMQRALTAVRAGALVPIAVMTRPHGPGPIPVSRCRLRRADLLAKRLRKHLRHVVLGTLGCQIESGTNWRRAGVLQIG